MSFIVEVSGVEAAFAGLDPSTVAKGTARGLNKMGQQVKTAMKKRLRGIYVIKAGAVDKAIVVIPASASYLVTTVRATGRPISFVHYQARQLKRGVSVRVKRSSGTTLLPGKFLQQVKSLRGVFFRPDRLEYPRRRGNLPIHAFSGPSVPQLFGSRASFADLQRFVSRHLSALIGHEVMFEINKKTLRSTSRWV